MKFEENKNPKMVPIAKDLLKFEKSLEKKCKLISEAVQDVITISHLNNNEDALNLIKEQFIVINRLDLMEE